MSNPRLRCKSVIGIGIAMKVLTGLDPDEIVPSRRIGYRSISLGSQTTNSQAKSILI